MQRSQNNQPEQIRSRPPFSNEGWAGAVCRASVELLRRHIQSKHSSGKMSTPTLALHYFAFPGRAAPIRQALQYGKVAFEDVHIPFSEWPSRKSSYPFGAVPVLYVGGEPLAQSNAILHYVGSLTGLLPSDGFLAARSLSVAESIEDFSSYVRGFQVLHGMSALDEPVLSASPPRSCLHCPHERHALVWVVSRDHLSLTCRWH